MIMVDLAEVRFARQLEVLDSTPPPVDLNFNRDFQPPGLKREETHPGIANKLDHYFPVLS